MTTETSSDRYETMAVTVDVALVAAVDGHLASVVVRRDQPPERGKWALPGGFVRRGETLEQTAMRVLVDKAGIDGVFVEQLYTFGAPGRDPRMRVVTIAHYALVDAARLIAIDAEADKARVARLSVPWQGETGGPVELVDDSGADLELAFDHHDILGMVVKRMRGKLSYSPIGFQLLPTAFTLRNLQQVHESVLGRSLNKDSFRRKMLASGELEATGERQHGVEHRPAELYRFVRRSAV